jgi:perosamine synthetase
MNKTFLDREPLIKKTIFTNMADIGKEEIEAAKEVLRENRLSVFTSGIISDFENRFAEYHGSDNAVSLNSGTASLHTALLACGISGGDEIIVPAYTYMATAMSVLQAGAKPVFVDIDYDTFNIDPSLIERSITKRTKAIIPVHLFGQPAEMGHIMDISEKHNLTVIEDCAHSLSASYKGKKVGTMGHVGCFSFQENKNITTGGEGGMLITDDDQISKNARTIANEGEVYSDGESSARVKPGPLPFDYTRVGYNYRMNALQAAIGIVQLKRMDKITAKRLSNARYYMKNIRSDGLVLPKTIDEVKHVFSGFVVKIDEEHLAPRDMLLMALNSERVPATTYYPKPLNAYKIFSGSRSRFRNTERVCKEQILLPVYSSLERKDLEDITETFNRVADEFRNTGEVSA